jgi:hypothetical protein
MQNIESPQVINFLDGLLDGAGVSGLSKPIAGRIGMAILPPGQKSDWRDLLQKVDPSETHYLGHQFACVLASVKPKSRDDALANLFRLMDQCQKLAGS